jgi:hypothetical protein
VTAFYHSGPVYEAFDHIIRRVETWMVEKVWAILGFDETVVRERLVQAIAEIGLIPFASLCAHRLAAAEELIPPIDQGLDIGGLVIDPADGKVQLTPRLLVKSLALFIFMWLQMLGNILLGFLSYRTRDNTPTTLLFGLGAGAISYQGSDLRFVQFCRTGPIRPLAEAREFRIQDAQGKGSISDPAFVYVRSPVDVLVRDGLLGAYGQSRLLVAHFLGLFRFLGVIARFPLLSLLGRDVAHAAAIRALDRKGLIQAVVVTNSNLGFHPLWMRGPVNRGFKVHTIHYSQNSKPFVYARDRLVSDYPLFRHIRVDEHWAWTPGYRTYIEELGHKGPIHVVGPIVWHLPDPPLSRTHDRICVTVFDVTPVYADLAISEAGLINNYYSTDNMLRFIEEIISVCLELESKWGRSVQILLKHKRAFSKGFHDQRYIDSVESLSESRPQFELVEYSENMFSLLESSDLSISIPYTSVAYVASHLGKRAIYFDPSQELWPSHETTPFIEFASGRTELLQVVERVLAEVPGKSASVAREP